MPTPRKTTATTRRRTSAAPKASTTSRAKADQSIAARTGRTIAEKPYVSAAIATGAVTAVAALAAGAFFFSRRDQSISDSADELGTRIKDGISEARTKVADLGRKARDRVSGPAKTQEDYAVEALTLKETGEVDSLVDDQIKAGAVSY